MFKPGTLYTRKDIHDRLGGSKVSCLPMKDGQIVAACLLKSFSPEAPRVMLCGVGPKTTPASERLTRHVGPLPIFIKQAANRWEYMGAFEVVESLDGGARFEAFVAASKRETSDVSFVVRFERVNR